MTQTIEQTTVDHGSSEVKPKGKAYPKVRILFPRWTTLHTLLSGIIGKSLFIISLSLPISKIIFFGFDLSTYQTSLVGAVIIAVCFVLEKVFVPDLISEFLTSTNFAEHIIGRKERDTLDFWGEFSFFNKYQKSAAPVEIAHDIDSIKGFLPIQQGKAVFGDSRLVYTLATIKFHVCDKSRTFIRGTVSVLVIVGFGCLYFPILKSIKTVLLG